MPSSELSVPLASVVNPFHGVVIQDVWQDLAYDIGVIHQPAFEQCLAALDNVASGRSDSVLIYGAPGSGKTHLLSRLQQHLFRTSKDAPDRTLRCVFVAVRLQSSPTQLWQRVRQRLASDLLREEEGVTQLQRLVAHQVAAARSEPPRRWVSALRVLTRTDGESITEHLQSVAERLDLGRDLFVVLDHLVHRRFAFDATAWLKGDSLPDMVLEKLGVGRDEGDDREEHARGIVTALCRLAGETLPIVFCFDQLESVQSFPRDHEALFRFGRMAADLADADDNVLLISCLQSAFVEELHTSIREADRDRAFKRHVSLEPLTREQMELLIAQRLDGAEALRDLRQGAPDRFFPLDAAFVDDLHKRTPRTPRKIIAACFDRFEELRQGRAAAPVNVPEFLASAFSTRRREALEQHEPEDARQTLVHGLPMLWFALGKDGKPVSLHELQQSGADVILRGAGADSGVLVCNERSMNSLAARLKRLIRGADAAGRTGPILVRDARLKVPAAGSRTREYISELERKGYRFVQPELEALAALEALRGLLSDARSGDLSVRGETVPEAAVTRWFAEHPDAKLMELVDDIESQAPSDPEAELERDLSEFLLDEHVVGLDLVTKTLGATEARLRALAERRPDRFGLLQGPPAVLFAYVPDEALPEAKEAS